MKSFVICLLSHRFMHVFIRICSFSSLLFSSVPWYGYINIICLFTRWWTFGLCPVFGYYKENVMNIDIQVFVYSAYDFFLDKYPEVIFLGHMVNVCLFFFKRKTVFQRGHIILLSHLQCLRVPVFYIVANTWYYQFLKIFGLLCM